MPGTTQGMVFDEDRLALHNKSWCMRENKAGLRDGVKGRVAIVHMT